MKRILLIATLFSALFFSNCKKDNPHDFLEGKWKVTKLISGTEDVIQGDEDYKSSVTLEFSNAGSVIFNIKTVDLSGNPPQSETFTYPGFYSWSGDNILTITVHTPDETLTVTGIADLTADHFVFTRTSGTDEDFIDILEADKI